MKSELLAPAGNIEAFYAAIENYADAVYLGGRQFGARAYADNFSDEQIRQMIDYAHLFDVKVYVTVNTIVFDDEIEALLQFLDFLYLNQCDGVIVQDLGVANIIHHRYPDFPLHASTQMNIHSLAQVKALKEMGFSRVVLARELEIEEIKAIKAAVDIELEVFIHGALCVSHSGNCFFSSIVGKRSGNRGRCAQPCRMEYTIADETGYLISPKDLITIDRIGELLDAKIDSLKIEGRMKRPEYVAQVVRSYHQAIQSYQEGTLFNIDDSVKEMKKLFNRSFTKGFLFHEENQHFVNKEHSNHIGIEVGKAVSSTKDWVWIQLTEPVETNDSIRIVAEKSDAITINQIYLGKTVVAKASPGDTIRIKAHSDQLSGGIVYLTSSASQLKGLAESYLHPSRQIAIRGRCYLFDNHLYLEVTDGENTVFEHSLVPVEAAKKTPSNNRILEQIQKTANTKFRFSEISDEVDKPVFINIPEINDLRRRTLEKLEIKRKEKYSFRSKDTIQDLKFESIAPVNQGFLIKAKVRNEEQLQAAVKFPFDELYVTDMELMKFQNQYPNLRFSYVLPRIHKKDKDSMNSLVSSDISLLANAATSVYMNIANIYALHFLERKGVRTIGLSIELSFSKIKAMIKNHQQILHTHPNLELMVYGRYELMMFKYCPIKNTVGCPACRKKNVEMKDRKGFSFPLLRDEDCTVKVLNSKKLHLIEYLNEIKMSGVNNILLDFTDETYQEVEDVCNCYIKGEKINIEDVTYGHFKEGVL